MTTLQAFFGRFYVGDSLDDLDVGGSGITLTQGNYFLSGYTGEGTVNLCEHLEDEIQALGGGYADATVTYDLSTKRVTINLTVTATITWTDGALQTLLGFTGTQSGASSYTGSQTPQHVWHPSREITHYPGNSTNIFLPRSTTSIGRANDGTTFSVVGNIVYDAQDGLSWELLDESEILLPSSGSIGDDLESFFEDVVHQGQPIRLILDTSSYAASTDYVTFLWGEEDEDNIGAFADYMNRDDDSYQGLWNIRIPVMKYIEA